MTEFIEKPITIQSKAARKRVNGIGINDANYRLSYLDVELGRTIKCPFYTTWTHMLGRCYSPTYSDIFPTYMGCSVVIEWHTFSNFRRWMKTQDWKGKQLDKDILIKGNKEYGPTSCIFVSGRVNSLLISSSKDCRGLPVGVSLVKKTGKFKARINNGFGQLHIGTFKTEKEASHAYLMKKSEIILEVANSNEALGNLRLRSALLRHYESFRGDGIKVGESLLIENSP